MCTTIFAIFCGMKYLLKYIFIMLFGLAAGMAIFSYCNGDNSAKACQRVAYCYKTKDAPNQRKCNMDRAVSETQAAQAEKNDNLLTPVYEDCWDF